MNDALFALLVAPINKVIHYTIGLDPDSDKLIATINNNTIKIHLSDLDFYFYIVINEQITITRTIEGEAQAELSAKSTTYLDLLLKNKDILKSDVHYQGNVQLGQKVQTFFQSLDIDWEDTLAGFTGDMIAHQAMRGFSNLSDWLKRFSTETKLNIQEYLVEESRVTPSKMEQDNFFDDIDNLLERYERLEARVKRLEQS